MSLNLKDVNSTLHTVLQGLSELNQSEIDLFDLILFFFVFVIIGGCAIAVLECFNIACTDKTRKSAKRQNQLFQTIQNDENV